MFQDGVYLKSVSYTHLTLPTICSVQISVVAVSLKKNNFKIVKSLDFPDHYNYSKIDLDNLIKKAKEKNSILLTTEKDYFRIHKDYRKNIDCLKIKAKIEKENEFIEEIKKVI